MKKRKAGALTGVRRVKPKARRRTVRRPVAAPDDPTPRAVADALLKLTLDKTTGVVAVPAPPLAPWLQDLMRDPDGWARRTATDVFVVLAPRKRRKK